jgi:hypothetical protein
MPPLGWSVDRMIGLLSRGLHVRRAKLNTVGDLGQYLGILPDVLFPTPGEPPDVQRAKSCLPVGRGHQLEILRWKSQHVPICPRYQSRHAGPYASNQTAWARWIHPRSGPRPRALVYVHGWLEPGPWPEQFFFLPHVSEALDVDVLHVQLPFHGDRTPRSSLFHGEFFWTGDLVRSIEAVRQSCTDARSLVAWLRQLGYVEVGVTGFSMGASIAMVLACLDSPPDYLIPIVGHLQISDAIENAPIFWRMKTDLERFGIDRDGRREIFDGLGLERMRPLLPPERQLWIMARDDGYVTAPRVEEQWQAWRRPPIEWIPGGHMTFAFSLPHIIRRMKEFHTGLSAPTPTRLAAIHSPVA